MAEEVYGVVADVLYENWHEDYSDELVARMAAAFKKLDPEFDSWNFKYRASVY